MGYDRARAIGSRLVRPLARHEFINGFFSVITRVLSFVLIATRHEQWRHDLSKRALKFYHAGFFFAVPYWLQ